MTAHAFASRILLVRLTQGRARWRLPLAVAAVCSLTAIAGHRSACAQGAQAPVVAADAKWEELPRAGKVFGEGVVAAKDGKVYITDITAVPNPDENPGGTIYRYDPASGAIAKHLEPSGLANGLHVDNAGDLWIAQFAGPKGLRRVARQDLKTSEVKVMADAYRGKRLNGPNDLTSDAQGRIYFTDALYAAQDAMELPNAVYRLDRDGTLTQISTDLLRPNGIEVSPDGKTLFVAACNAAALRTNPNGPASDKFGIEVGGVVAYDLADGKISNGRLIYQHEICADGMAMDSDGNLYLAQHNGNRQAPKSEIAVIDRTGKLLEQFPSPLARTS
ncbi:MAG: SMP-30/gluconolactonase/LRE family protein [Hyphomicrobiales bacterium]|nr:SMP-30/gluconolactonase/LRE family protein [Hyphomicrobiales bacterium]